jgi:hypothetical protein
MRLTREVQKLEAMDVRSCLSWSYSVGPTPADMSGDL